MSEITSLKSVAFKMDSSTLDSASEVLKKNGYSLTKGLTLFLKNTAITQTVDLPSEEELEKEAIFNQLQAEIKEGIDSYERGEGKSLAEVRNKLGV